MVPVAPAPVRIAGRTHLAYELHITSFRPADVELARVEVVDADTHARLAAWRGSDLAALLGRPGQPFDAPDKQLLAPGARAVLYLWLDLGAGADLPHRLQHRIEFDLLRPAGREHVAMQGSAVEVRREQPLVLSPPLRAGPWAALYDPKMMAGHRTSIYTLDGRARIPARYAIDWIRLEDDASRARGDSTRIVNWHGYGAEVLAVADGVVAQALDDIAEDASISAAHGPMALEQASGNYVTLDLGGGRFAFYEHLKRGSLRVKRGERVTRGQVIGQLGNSGSSSSGPHLHFHVADSNATLAAEGLPYVFSRFEVLGAYDTIEDHTRGELWKSVAEDAGGVRKLELPAASAVVMFD